MENVRCDLRTNRGGGVRAEHTDMVEEDQGKGWLPEFTLVAMA